MSVKNILLAVAVISFSSFSVNAATPPLKKAGDHGSKVVSTPLKSIFNPEHTDSTLFADNVKPTNKKRMMMLNDEIAKNIKSDMSEEDLMYPAVDVYGKDSWSSFVNPYAGRKNVTVPDTFNIDCTTYAHPLGTITRVNSRYGYRRRFKRMHYGIDLKLNVGDTVYSAFDGRVRIVDFERRGYGNYVVVRHPNGLETVYGHLSKTIVKPNQIVRAGEPIALGGNTGRSTGPHLHFETRFLGIALNPEHLVNFNTGIPLKEQYTFLRKSQRVGRTVAYNGRSGGKSSDASGNNIVVHKIRKGDTLSSIASKYGVSVRTLCRLNGVSTRTTLKVGRTLRVSA